MDYVFIALISFAVLHRLLRIIIGRPAYEMPTSSNRYIDALDIVIHIMLALRLLGYIHG